MNGAAKRPSDVRFSAADAKQVVRQRSQGQLDCVLGGLSELAISPDGTSIRRADSSRLIVDELDRTDLNNREKGPLTGSDGPRLQARPSFSKSLGTGDRKKHLARNSSRRGRRILRRRGPISRTRLDSPSDDEVSEKSNDISSELTIATDPASETDLTLSGSLSQGHDLDSELSLVKEIRPEAVHRFRRMPSRPLSEASTAPESYRAVNSDKRAPLSKVMSLEELADLNRKLSLLGSDDHEHTALPKKPRAH